MKPDERNKRERQNRPEKQNRPDKPERPNRPISGSGPDPCGLVASLRCVIELPGHSEKGPSKKSCSSGAGVDLMCKNLLFLIRRQS